MTTKVKPIGLRQGAAAKVNRTTKRRKMIQLLAEDMAEALIKKLEGKGRQGNDERHRKST